MGHGVNATENISRSFKGRGNNKGNLSLTFRLSASASKISFRSQHSLAGGVCIARKISGGIVILLVQQDVLRLPFNAKRGGQDKLRNVRAAFYIR